MWPLGFALLALALWALVSSRSVWASSWSPDAEGAEPEPAEPPDVGPPLAEPEPGGPEAEPEREPPAPGPSWRLSGRGAQLPAWEQDKILAAAAFYGVDPAALAALRVVENGGPGREYGVLSVPAPSYDAQLHVAAQSFRNAEARYAAATGQSARDAEGRYTGAFLRAFSARWAPIGADNDPRGLNAHHADNLLAVYGRVGTAFV